MAISPPSDIVLDVARAVEPAGVEAARAQLAQRAAGAGGNATATFSLGDAAFDKPPVMGADPGKSPETFKRFEAMVLQTFIQSMLPKDAENVYGKGVAGDMWKSMMASKIADTMAERGGIGIADRMLTDHYVDGKDKVPIGPMTNSAAHADSDEQAMLSTALVQQMQRKLARTLSEDQSAIAAKPTS